MKTQLIVKLVLSSLIMVVCHSLYATQINSVTGESEYSASVNNHYSVPIILAESTTEISEEEVVETYGESIEQTTQEEAVVQDTLQRSAPTAVDTNLQSNSFIGEKTKRALSGSEGIQVDPTTGLFPSITIGVNQIRNPEKVTDKGERRISTNINPKIAYRNKISNRHRYEVGVSGAVNDYSKLSNLDSNTWAGFARFNLDISEKIKADIYANYSESVDPRGGTGSRVIAATAENDKFKKDTIGGQLTIGRKSNRIQLTLAVRDTDVQYTNNNQSHRDKDNTSISGGVYWNVGRKTSLFVNREETDKDFTQSSQGKFDSTEKSTNFGVGWEPTNHISIVFKMGDLEKVIANPALKIFNDTVYSGRVKWSPTRHSNMGIFVSKAAEESSFLTSPFIVSEVFGIDYSYNFTDRFQGRVYINEINDDLINIRVDETTDYGIGVSYDLAQWISLTGNWTRSERDSTDSDAEYKSNSYSISATIKPVRVPNFDL